MRAFFLLLALMAKPLWAVEDPAPVDAVEAIRAAYYDQFRGLPPSRKCTPRDAWGAWKELAIYEYPGKSEIAAQQANGSYYMVFGDQYNRMIWGRVKNPLTAAQLYGFMPNAKKQFIMTTAGMLYVYMNGTLLASLVCSVSTEATNNYPKDMLLLALPVEKDKPLIITIYAPLK